MRRSIIPALVLAVICARTAHAETPDEWIRLGARVHGGFGAFIPLGIRIGEDALNRLKAERRGVSVTFHDGEKAPCACLADGIALATVATVGQRSLTIAPEKAPPGTLAVVVVRSKATGEGVRYVVPGAALPRLGDWNRSLDERGRYDAVMSADGLFALGPADEGAN